MSKIKHYLFCFSDLSNTAITYLPVDGLGDIETLIVQNTVTLKKVPSVLNFRVSDY